MSSVEYTDWANYRLGDFFHRPEGKRRHGQFPGTIIDQYYMRTSEQSDYDVLHEVIDEVRSARQVEAPGGDCCVVHLRTGDIIDNSEFTVDELLAKKRYFQLNSEKKYIRQDWNQYVKTMKYYAEVAKKLKKLGITRLSFSYNLDFFVAGSRKYDRPANHDKSAEYVQRIHEFFRERSFEVIKYECRDVDYDFIYMCGSRFFVPSGGGLSRTISNIVSLKGNTVVSSRH